MEDVSVGNSNAKAGAFSEATQEEQARGADEEDGDQSSKEETAIFLFRELFALLKPTPDEVDADDKGEHEAVSVDESGERERQSVTERFLVAFLVEHNEKNDGERKETVTTRYYGEEINHGEGKNEDDTLVKFEREVF